MRSETIDYINIALLIISFIAAIFLPFELFLFSYAFLGPLHYLTEINWLDDKKYFIKSKSQAYIAFIIFAAIIAIYPLIKYLDYNNEFFNVISSKKNVILLIGFMFSVSLIIFTKAKQLILAFAFSALFSVICFLYIPKIVLALGVFLPTLIHVYVFTLLFMIYGQLKHYSNAGLICVILLIVFPITLLFMDLVPESYMISDFAKSTYIASGFLSINNTIAGLFGNLNTSNFGLMSSIIVKVQVFIAFAYTYHYLNWFSKTSIIGWKASLSSSRMKYIVFLWICSVGLYLYDYVTGLIALFFLSLLHVVLEFPLNITTIKEIGLAVVKKLNLRSN
ncbi:hypothetical protein [Winogradskyella sp.]|uniref:hypothetical protein n=1 Tax=Winogradskyella sp. TaxID=1883156 RepID=UPI0025F7598A|nr:hypothetical protein [Winogradskyella sp.]